MDLNKIEELIKILEDSGTQELSVRKGDFAVHVKKGKKPKVTAKPKVKARAASAVHSEVVNESASGDQFVFAPMVGVFRAADDVMHVGNLISAGQVVGAIESMKLLNDVVSDVSGIITEVLAEDGTPVEYGQPLCKVELAQV